MNIHLPAILMWTTGVQGFDTLPYGDFSRMGRTKLAEFPLGMEKKTMGIPKKQDGAPSRAKAWTVGEHKRLNSMVYDRYFTN